MGDLNRRHERMLAISLEDTRFFGTAFTLISNDATPLRYYLNGQVTVSAKTMDNNRMADVIGVAESVAVRYSTLLNAANHPALNWQDRMPKTGWRFEIKNEIDCKKYSYIVDDGAIFRDHTMGIWLFMLSEYEPLS